MTSQFSRLKKQSALTTQVKWQDEDVLRAGIDQTHLAIADAPTGHHSFSFSVIGDTDTGAASVLTDSGQPSKAADFATAFAQQMTAHLKDSRFLLHTGDVTYPDGSFDNYINGFLKPYQVLLSQLPTDVAYQASDIVFKLPLLPVAGNHDYATVSRLKQLWQTLVRSGQNAIRNTLGVDWGRCGGQGGEAYAQTFLDNLAKLSPDQLSAHLKAHYSAKTHLAPALPTASKKYCINYSPEKFTRLPNRYYSFRYGGIDFFALDSNTWNCASETKGFDHEQLTWLEKSLSQSWQDPNSLGRIIYLHHSPYTTEVVRAHQQETLWVRRHLRHVFDQVALNLSLHQRTQVTKQALSLLPTQPPVVDLVISGHAHCLEYLKTNNTGHADYHTDWLVCGGSGRGLRAQCADSQILENVFDAGRAETKVVARSELYAGVHHHGNVRQKLHSFVRVDICPEAAQLITLRPFVVMLTNEQWETKALAPIHAGRCRATRNISLAV